MDSSDTPEQTNIFYAASLSFEMRSTLEKFEPRDFISSDKEKIIALIKKYKDSRFKNFNSYQDALKFASESSNNETLDTSLSGSSAPLDSVPPFPSLDVRALNTFKRAIENNDLLSVKSNVEANPRYLFSYNSDGHTILMQGPRYNAAHIAVRKRAAEVLEYVLNTINSLEFIQRCFPNLDSQSLIEKRDHLLDMYLNTPDKINFDTPLHFACKIGCLRCIDILLNYVPMCNLDIKNKQNLTPREVIRNEELREEIIRKLDSCMYITVTRSDDNLDFKINRPCFGRKSLHSHSPSLSHVSAIVGPMTPEKAKTVYDNLKSPIKLTPQQRSFRLQDPIRGVEKAARHVCLNYNVPFEEYWSFLDGYADICTEKGLIKLNQHLQSMHNDLFVEQVSDKFKLLNVSPDLNSDTFFDTSPPVDEDEADDIFYTPPDSLPNEHIQVDRFFINGSIRGQIDLDVFSVISIAVENERIVLKQLEQSHPFVHQWYNVMQNVSGSST